MDTLTHIALGACIGELFTDKQFGKKAMVWGALAQSIPDIDFISVAWLGPTEELIAHRGFTHSLLFGVLATFFLALTAERYHRPGNISLRRWMFFLGTEVFVHLLIDSFNNYGVGWFEPFWDKRISFNTIFVVDPFFSIPSGIICLALIFLPSDHHRRIAWSKLAISITALYLLYGLFNKAMVFSDVKKLAAKQEVKYDRAFTTPTPFNTWLWFVVIEQQKGYQVGYRSFFDQDDSLHLTFFPKNEALLSEIKNHPEVRNLKKFSQGYYTVEKRADTLVFNDLRFGQQVGWYDPRQQFAFHYYLNHPEDNALVVQRGRFALWNKATIKSFFYRIGGWKR